MLEKNICGHLNNFIQSQSGKPAVIETQHMRSLLKCGDNSTHFLSLLEVFCIHLYTRKVP